MKSKAVLVLSMLLAMTCLAGGVCRAQGETKVLVTVLLASNEGHDFNLENDAYRDELIKLFSYTSYHQIGQRYAEIKAGQSQTVMLPDDYEMVLTYQGEDKGRLQIGATIRKEGKQYVNTVLSSVKSGVVVLGGPPLQNGVMIIVLEMGF